jgi:hypothetical protein
MKVSGPGLMFRLAATLLFSILATGCALGAETPEQLAEAYIQAVKSKDGSAAQKLYVDSYWNAQPEAQSAKASFDQLSNAEPKLSVLQTVKGQKRAAILFSVTYPNIETETWRFAIDTGKGWKIEASEFSSPEVAKLYVDNVIDASTTTFKEFPSDPELEQLGQKLIELHNRYEQKPDDLLAPIRTLIPEFRAKPKDAIQDWNFSFWWKDSVQLGSCHYVEPLKRGAIEIIAKDVHGTQVSMIYLERGEKGWTYLGMGDNSLAGLATAGLKPEEIAVDPETQHEGLAIKGSLTVEGKTLEAPASVIALLSDGVFKTITFYFADQEQTVKEATDIHALSRPGDFKFLQMEFDEPPGNWTLDRVDDIDVKRKDSVSRMISLDEDGLIFWEVTFQEPKTDERGKLLGWVTFQLKSEDSELTVVRAPLYEKPEWQPGM